MVINCFRPLSVVSRRTLPRRAWRCKRGFAGAFTCAYLASDQTQDAGRGAEPSWPAVTQRVWRLIRRRTAIPAGRSGLGLGRLTFFAG